MYSAAELAQLLQAVYKMTRSVVGGVLRSVGGGMRTINACRRYGTAVKNVPLTASHYQVQRGPYATV